nr:D-alanyl-D-alanine carboxypeptidase [bacterium]
MYHITRFPLLLVLILLAAPALSRARPPGKQLERFLKKEILPELPAGARLQLSVRDATNGKIIFSRQGDANCVPASTLKLLTAGLALNTLGPEFCFNTHLALRPDSIRCDTIYGDIVLTADGDPTLTTVDLEDLSAAFVSRVSGGQNTPVRVRGDLLLSTAVFDTLYRGPGWMWDDGDRPWAADITPFIVNRNCIGLECVQGEQGQRLYWLPALQLFPVSMGGGSTVRRLAGNRFEIGNGAFDLEPVLRVRNLEEPQLVYSLALKQLLAEQGVVVSGEVRLNHLPDSSSTDTFSTVHRSVPLAELSGPLLRQSNNLYAEALFKRCAFETTG